MRKLLIATIISLFLTVPNLVSAGGSVKAEFDTTLNAFVDVDGFSTVEIIPSSNEIGLESVLTARILDRNGNPLSGHTVVFYPVNNPGSVVVVQPGGVSDSDGYARGTVKALAGGAYVIKAYDSTYASGDIVLQDSDTLYAFPVPTPELDSEPNYTKGTTNKLYWQGVSGPSEYEYYLQASIDSAFNDITASSGWVSSSAYEFSGLSGGTIYFYRVKARNAAQSESGWSNAQFSVQDSQSPVIKIEEISGITESEDALGLNVDFNVTDDLALKSVTFFCVRSSGEWEECGSLEADGSSYRANIPISDLERGPLFSFLDSYSFCIEADDEAGNVSRNCEVTVELDEYIETPVPIFTNIINSLISYSNEALEKVEERTVTTLASVKITIIELLSVILLIVFLLMSVTLITGSIFLFPIYVLLLFIKFLSMIGLRGHGKPLGIVYDAVSKKPIKWAIVDIYDGRNRHIRRDVTNSEGEFSANLNAGKYRINVRRYGFLFPTQLVKGKEDKKKGDIYKGEYRVTSKKESIDVVIPLDPINMEDPDESKVWQVRRVGLLKSASLLVAVVGFSLSTFVFQDSPSFFRMTILLLYIPVLGIYLKNVISWRLVQN